MINYHYFMILNTLRCFNAALKCAAIRYEDMQV